MSSDSAAATLRQVRHTSSVATQETVEARLAEGTSLVSLENLDVPTEVQPGENIPISIDVRNDAQIVGFADPDHCIAPNLFDGFRLDIVARVEGIERDRITRCIATRQVRDVQLTVRAPSTTGRVTLTLQVEGANSGNLADEVTFTVDVLEDATAQPCPAGFQRDPETGQCVLADDDGDGTGDGGSEGPVEQAEGILTLLVILAGLALVGGVVGG